MPFFSTLFNPLPRRTFNPTNENSSSNSVTKKTADKTSSIAWVIFACCLGFVFATALSMNFPDTAPVAMLSIGSAIGAIALAVIIKRNVFKRTERDSSPVQNQNLTPLDKQSTRLPTSSNPFQNNNNNNNDNIPDWANPSPSNS